MPLDLDPIFHTETMVRILKEQGSSLYAMELAEKILAQNPGNASVKRLLEELKEEAKSSFERFRQAGQTSTFEKQGEESGDNREVPEEDGKDVIVEAAPTANAVMEETPPVSPLSKGPRVLKIKKLKGYLEKLQHYRKSHESY